eukprot:1911827-Rhodomonas_salina.3
MEYAQVCSNRPLRGQESGVRSQGSRVKSQESGVRLQASGQRCPWHQPSIPSSVAMLTFGGAQHGTLADRLKAQEGKAMDEAQIWKWSIQVAVGLQHMHSRHVLHRDLKSANVFITAQQDAKIGDLGVSK